jgi:site-specific DNA-cytosine methylase
MNFLDLFSGIGGFSKGLEKIGMKCVGQVEIDDYCNKILEKIWPNVKRMKDIREVKGDEFGKIDLICGSPHVNQYPVQEKEKEQKITVGSGQKLFASYKLLDQNGSYLRMLVELLLCNQEWFSIRCSLIWKVMNTKCNRLIYQLVPLMHHTEEKEYGLWPTPAAFDANNVTAYRKDSNIKTGGKHSVSLTHYVHYMENFIPTPVAYDATPGGKNNHYKGLGNLAKHYRETFLPTPTARDYKGARLPETFKQTGRNPLTNTLSDCVDNLNPATTDEGRGMLNADWVSWLMGFPINHTKLINEDNNIVIEDNWMKEPNIPRIIKKQKDRKKRLICLGNAVVPKVVEIIGKAILEAEEKYNNQKEKPINKFKNIFEY